MSDNIINTDNNGAATAAPVAPAANNWIGSDAWAKERADDIMRDPRTGKVGDRALALVSDFDPAPMSTANDVASEVCKKFFEDSPATLPELYHPVTAKAYLTLMRQTISLVISFYNVNHPSKEERINLTASKTYDHFVLIYALFSTGCIKTINYNSGDGEVSQYVIREYTPRDGYTGIWIPFTFGSRCPSPLRNLIQVMYPGITSVQKRDLLGNMLDTYQPIVTQGTDITMNWDFALTPCNNGIYDHRDHSFISWNDADAIDEKYPDLCFLWKLSVDYNPSATCPSYLDPYAYIDSLFNVNVEIGQASAHIIWQTVNFAIRRYAGDNGYDLYLCNGQGQQAGRNGKSTLIKLITLLFGYDGHHPLINFTPMAQSFEGFGSASILNEILHVSTEQNRAVEGVDAMKAYIRYDTVKIRQKYLGELDYTSYCPKIQASNGFPDFGKEKVKEQATFRRHIVLAFEKNFEEGSANWDPDIGKNIKKREFLEYFLLQLLNMPFATDYDHKDLAAVEENRQEMIADNMPTQYALEEILADLPVSTIPLPLLHELYTNWSKANGYNHSVSDKTFTKDVDLYVDAHSDKWRIEKGNKRPLRVGEIAEYAALKDCEVLLDYATIDTQFAEKEPTPYNRPAVTGKFDIKFLKRKQYKSFLIAV